MSATTTATDVTIAAAAKCINAAASTGRSRAYPSYDKGTNASLVPSQMGRPSSRLAVAFSPY
jgi:hypothetical protein